MDSWITSAIKLVLLSSTFAANMSCGEVPLPLQKLDSEEVSSDTPLSVLRGVNKGATEPLPRNGNSVRRYGLRNPFQETLFGRR